MEMHFGTIWEHISDIIPDRLALIHGNNRRTWREYDDRSARIAGALTSRGIGAGAKVAIYTYNANEYLEAQNAIFKMSGCPINVNYRYMEDELVYLLDNSDSEAIFFHACFSDRIALIRDRLPDLKLYIQVDDGNDTPLLEGALDYEILIAESEPMPRISRQEDEIYMLYTGGTTGMPKGVMYYISELCGGMKLGYGLVGMEQPDSAEAIIEGARNINEADINPVSLVCCPLMHGTGVWLGAMVPMLMGGTVVTVPNQHLDPHALWRATEENRVNYIIIVGDAFAKPMLRALDEAKAEGRPYDLSSVKMIASSGVMWTTEVKKRMLEHVNTMLIDVLGATEGTMGSSMMTRDNNAETAKFVVNDTTKVFTDDGREVEPGSGEIGKIANGGFCPIGYYKDPEKSHNTFKVINGKRYSIPGDYATIEADGSITLLGRGSMCINTMGEKVFPEEVEEAIKTHRLVFDCLVVGVKDPDYGERVTAIVSLISNAAMKEDDIIEYLRSRIAGYKKPKNVFIVDTVQRHNNGKADYKWAQKKAKSLFEALP